MRLSQFTLLITLANLHANLHRQALGGLVEYDQTHRDLESIRQEFGFQVESDLKFAHGFSAIREISQNPHLIALSIYLIGSD